jgi:hypothetical protein
VSLHNGDTRSGCSRVWPEQRLVDLRPTRGAVFSQACAMALPYAALRQVPAALAQSSDDFRSIHENATLSRREKLVPNACAFQDQGARQPLLARAPGAARPRVLPRRIYFLSAGFFAAGALDVVFAIDVVGTMM